MNKVLVVGAGAQGGPCASILSKEKDVSEIILGDLDVEVARKVKEKIGSDKITPIKLDAANIADIEKAAGGVDVIINLVVTEFDMNIMQAALNSGAHYVDTSFGEATSMDILARDNILAQVIENRPLAFDSDFKKAGLTALVGCGASPGEFNILAKYLCDKLDRVDGIDIRSGYKFLGEPKEVVSEWLPGWSPFRALWGYAVEPMMFEDGKYKKYPIFAPAGEYDLPEPVGKMALVYHQHQEPITLPRFIGKGIKYCYFKYPIDSLAGAFVKMGFHSAEPIDVKGVKVAPNDVLMKLVSHPVNDFLNENEESLRKPLQFTYTGNIEVKGAKSGEEITYTLANPIIPHTTTEERLALYRRFGATGIGVALPAVVGARMCVEGEAEKGTIVAECLDPVRFLKTMAGMGVTINLRETCSKRIAIS